MLEQLEERT
jgi:hypothetical protein